MCTVLPFKLAAVLPKVQSKTGHQPRPKERAQFHHRISKSEVLEIQDQRNAGKSIRQIASATGISKSTISDVLANPHAKRPLSRDEIEQARKKIRSGSTIRATAEHFGVPLSTLHDALNQEKRS